MVGKHLMKLAADDMKRTTMELGGHGPVLVFDDVDVDRVLDTMVAAQIPQRRAGLRLARRGSSSRNGVFEQFPRRLCRARARRIKVGNGLDDGIQMGPMANPRRPDAMERMIGDAVARGAQAARGGERIGNQGYFYAPSVLIRSAARCRDHERGAVRPGRDHQSVRGEEAMIAEANRLPYGLAAYGWTRTPSARSASRREIETGMFCVNTTMIGGAGYAVRRGQMVGPRARGRARRA